jgi:hypothetical protein
VERSEPTTVFLEGGQVVAVAEVWVTEAMQIARERPLSGGEYDAHDPKQETGAMAE